MKGLTTKRLCRAGVIAALYATLTYVFMPLAFGPFQVRPAEALCILPLFYPEAIPALTVGCMLSNLTSPYLVYDVAIGSLATLLSSFITYMVGRFIRRKGIKFLVGGIFPVVINAILLPFVIVFLCGEAQGAWAAYFALVGAFVLTESVWVYGLGYPLYAVLYQNQIHK